MRKKIFSLMLTVTILMSIFGIISTTTNAADEPKKLYDADILSNGNIAILYISSGDIYFGILESDSNNWSKSKIAEGKEAAFDLDSKGFPHVAYITTDDNLGYIVFNGTSWSNPEIIDSIAFGGVDGALTSPDIAVDSNGKAHISYLDAKGGYTDGNDYSSYEKEDLIYANNSIGSFVKEVISYSHGWFYSPDGWRNLVYAPTKITLTNDAYGIGAKQYQFYKWMGGQDHTYSYNLFFSSSSLSYSIRSASTNNDLGFKLFEIDSDGSTVYSLFNKSGSLYVTAGITELTGATKAFAASGADLFVNNDGNLYYAGISANNLLLYQNGSFKENITLPYSINTTHTRISTVTSSDKQYVLYTDAAGDLWICNVSANFGDLTLNSYKIPDKLPVTIDGVTIENKVYDGEAIVPTGTLSVTGGNLTAEDLLFTYSSTDGAGYNSTTPPINVGNYKLIISVPEENPTYIGSSNEIFFSITPKVLTITGITAIDRNYDAGNIIVALNTDNSSLLGVFILDEPNVSLEKSEAKGTIEDSNAANDKIVTVTGFTLAGTAAGNYSLTQPTNITVNILPKTLKPPTVTLTSDTVNGGLSFTVSDSENSIGVGSYTVEVFNGSDLKKTITGVTKGISQNITLENEVIEPEVTYTAKAKAISDASGNYVNSTLGEASNSASAAYNPLVFIDSPNYDITNSKVGSSITTIDISTGITGGKLPYSFTTVGLPTWLSISDIGLLSGTPTEVALEGTATIIATDAQGHSQSITIAYGKVDKGNPLDFQGILPPTEKIYGDYPFAIELTYDGESSNVEYSVVSGPGSINDNILTINGAGNIVVRAKGTSVNYADETQDYTINVNKKLVTITPAAGNNTKVYGEIDPLLTFTNSELVAQDSLSGIILERTAGENVGSYAITIAESAEINNPNYQFSLAPSLHNFTIAQKPLTIANATIYSKVYDGTVTIDASDVTTVTLNGDIDNMVLGTDFEVLSAFYTDNAYAGATKPTSVTIALKDTSKANNYKFEEGANTFNEATAGISAAIQTLTAANQSLTLSNSLDLSTIAFTNVPDSILTYSIEGGTSDYATLAGSVLTGIRVGEVIININSAAIDIGGNTDNEYSSADQMQITVSIVDKTPITITGVTIEDKTYDGSPIVVNGTATGSGGYNENFEYLYEGIGLTNYSSELPPTNAGSYKLTVRIPLSDPEFTGQQIINFNIQKASLTIKPQNLSINTNDALPTPTVEYVGLIGTDVGAEVATLSSGNLDMEIKDTDGNNALSNSTITGEYTIKFIGLPVFNEAQNYIITTNDGVLTINSRPSGGGGSGGSGGSGSYYTPPTISVTTEETTISTTNKTEISATTSSSIASASISTAVVNALIDKANQSGGTEKEDIIEVATDIQNNIDEFKVSILQSDLAKIITNTDSSLSITSQFVSITFDKKALETISNANTGGTVVITTRIIDNRLLSETDRVTVQDRPVYDLTVINGNKQISDFNDGYATITIPYTLKVGENPNSIVVFYLADDGSLKIVRGHYDSELKAVIFKTKHFSKFVIGYNPFVFNDVSTDAWYKEAIDFIAAREITLGTGDNKFSPDVKLTRAQFVVLLMNAYQINIQNQDEFNQNQNFSDAGNTYYTNYLLAAKNLGIVKGIGNNMFAPEEEITRQEMFVMLYNALKVIDELPTSTVTKELSSFNDSDQVANWGSEGLSYLVKAGVIEGTNNYLNPTSGTTRAEIAQVLFKLLSK